MAVALDDAEQLVPEHERAAVGGHAEEALGDLAVGAADADLEHAQQHAVAGSGSGTSATRVECGTPGSVTSACIRPR